MVIIFFDANDEKLYICTETDKTKVVSLDDPNIMDYVPNDDILYVQDAHFITKKQFGDWLSGDMNLGDPGEDTEVSRFSGFLDDSPGGWRRQPSPKFQGQNTQHQAMSDKWFIHPTHNGTIRLNDIKTAKYPLGLEMNGKWHFISIDDVGQDVLDESMNFQWALGKGKIEVVPAEYVKSNMHKQKQKVSPSESALNAILIPADMKAEAAAAAGGIHPGYGSDIPEILVEGDQF